MEKAKEPAGIGNGPVIVTFAAFVFLLFCPLDHRIVPFVYGMLYFVWWGIITSSHGIWRDKKALLWISIPIIVTLLCIRLFVHLYPLEAEGFILLGLALYSYIYNVWCNYHLKKEIPPIRLDILSLLTVAVYIFLINISLGSSHFIVTLLFPLWWLAITMRYKSWHRISTWVWACITLILLLLVPVTFMVLATHLGSNRAISIFFAVLFVYSSSYYLIIKRRA